MDKNKKTVNMRLTDEYDSMTQTGKTPQEMEPYLLAGDSDDLSSEYFEDL